jgi:hypothetical protein
MWQRVTGVNERVSSPPLEHGDTLIANTLMQIGLVVCTGLGFSFDFAEAAALWRDR